MDIKSATPFSGFFRSSPFKPVLEHMRTVFSCDCLIPPFIDALYRQDRNQIDEFGHNIIQLETEADTIKQTFRSNMPTTQLLPVGRENLLSLMSDQDRMADTNEDSAKSLLFKDMEVPDSLREVLDELSWGTMEISSAAWDIIERLDELVQVGFSGREKRSI